MPPLAHRNITVTNRMAREVVRWHASGLLTVDTPYQRASVWTEDQRRNLIRSWLLGVPIPALIVNDRGAAPWGRRNGRPSPDEPLMAAIDGRQRIETAARWFAGTLQVPSEWFPPEDLAADCSYDGLINYRDLTLPTQRHFAQSRATLPLGEAQLSCLAEEAEVYLLLNSAGTSQTDEDLARAARIAEGADQ